MLAILCQKKTAQWSYGLLPCLYLFLAVACTPSRISGQLPAQEIGGSTASHQILEQGARESEDTTQSSNAFDQAMRDLVEEIVRQIPKDAEHRIAVLNFTSLEGWESECGRFLADSLEKELVGMGKGLASISLVERRHQAMILQELRISNSDLGDETKTIEIGKQLGATLLLRAAVYPWSEGNLRAVCKLINAETTGIAVATSNNIPIPKGMRPLCIPSGNAWGKDQEGFLEANNVESSFGVQVWTDKAVYRIGEPVTIFAKSNSSGYLYLFDIDSKGVKKLLFPNAFSPEHFPIKVGETFVSPEGWFIAGRPVGRGYVKAIVTPQPMTIINTHFSDLPYGRFFRSITNANCRGITLKAKEMQGGFATWWLTIAEK